MIEDLIWNPAGSFFSSNAKLSLQHHCNCFNVSQFIFSLNISQHTVPNTEGNKKGRWDPNIYYLVYLIFHSVSV